MKTFPFLALAFLLSSCVWLENDLGFGTSRRSERYRLHSLKEREEDIRATADTFIYLSAVKVPEGYDWRRDTACGQVGCTLLFCRSRLYGDSISRPETLFGIPAGRRERISPDVDLHHIIGSHLYTEFSDASGTTVTRDGKSLVEYRDREILQGLLPLESGIWTLGRSLGGGFTLRKDGTPVYRQDSGSVFGGFNEPGYGQTGALYEDDGCVCFSFLQQINGRRMVYVVRNGEDKLLLSTTVSWPLDAKSCGGKDVLVSKGIDGILMQWEGESLDMTVLGLLEWLSGGIALRDGRPVFAGTFSWADEAGSAFRGGALNEDGIYCDLGEGSDRIYCSDSHFFGVGVSFSGIIYFQGVDSYGRVYASDCLDSPCYLFSPSCATLLADEYFLAVTPREEGLKPFVLGPHGRREVDVDGFLTGVAVEVCPRD